MGRLNIFIIGQPLCDHFLLFKLIDSANFGWTLKVPSFYIFISSPNLVNGW
jgi:hypothetical protein